eukprot:gene3824-6985_t
MMEQFINSGKWKNIFFFNPGNHRVFKLGDKEVTLIRKLIKKCIKTKEYMRMDVLTTYIIQEQNFHLLDIFSDDHIDIGNVFQFLHTFKDLVYFRTEKPNEHQKKFYKYLIDKLSLVFKTSDYDERVMKEYAKLLVMVDKTIAKELFYPRFLSEIVENLDLEDTTFFVEFYLKKFSKFSQMEIVYTTVIELFQKMLTSNLCEKPMDIFLSYIPKIFEMMIKLSLEHDKKDKKYKKIIDSKYSGPHEILQKMSEKYGQLISTIFLEDREAVILIVIPLIKEHLKSDDLVIFNSTCSLFISFRFNEKESNDIIDYGFVDLIWKRVNDKNMTVLYLFNLLDVMVEREIEQVTKIYPILYKLISEESLDPQFYIAMAEFIKSLKNSKMKDVIDFPSIIKKLMEQITLKEEKFFSFHYKEILYLVESFFEYPDFDLSNNEFKQLMEYFITTFENKIHKISSFHQTVNTLFTKMKRKAIIFLEMVCKSILKILNEIHHYFGYWYSDSVVSTLELIQTIVRIFPTDFDLMIQSNFIKQMIDLLDNNQGKVRSVCCSILSEMCSYSSDSLRTYMSNYSRENQSEELICIYSFVELYYGTSIDDIENIKYLDSAIFNISQYKSKEDINRDKMTFFCSMLTLSSETKRDFKMVNSKFKQFGKQYYSVISLYWDLLSENQRELVIDSFSKLVFENIEFCDQEIFPNLDIQNIKNRKEIENILYGKYHKLLPGIIQPHDLFFSFE